MVIGIDLGGMSAKAAVLSDGVLAGKSRVETNADDAPDQTAVGLVKLAAEAAESAGVKFEQVQAIGIGAPGVIDSANGAVVYWSNFDWRDVRLAELVRKHSGKPVYITNDANAAALGEAKFGAGMPYRDSVLVTLGTGVGGGIILNGKLFEGFRSAGAEIGHMTVQQDGDLCTCGRKGCYERYASTAGLIRRTREVMQAYPESGMWKIAPDLNKVDGRTAFDAMRQGDAVAKRVVSDYVGYVGEGIVNLVNLLRPRAVIIGGGISAEGETLLAPLREYVYPRIYVSETYAALDIVCAKLGNDAGLYGAAQFALDNL